MATALTDKLTEHLGSINLDAMPFSSCRYCYKRMDKQRDTTTPAFKDICPDQECSDKLKFACTKMLACGHSCGGIKDENTCLPCMHKDCSKQGNNKKLGEELCGICGTETLSQAPSLASKCGHTFHYECLKTKLDAKWMQKRIVFNICECPLCKKWLEFPNTCDLYAIQENHLKLKTLILEKSFKRLNHEGMLNDPKLTDPKSPFYKKNQEFAMDYFSYYMCFKCKSPFFGGTKDCERMLYGEVENQDLNNLICPKCSGTPLPKCTIHGADFVEFKCRFCCQIAVWNCGGTHYCEPCHVKPDGTIKPCQGPNTCPFLGKHNANGTETEYGCSLCKSIKQLASDF